VALVPIIPGAARTFRLSRLSGDPYVPSANRVLLVLDSPPTSPPPLRIVREYTPGGPNPAGVSADGDAVVFTLSPSDTASLAAHSGQWSVFVFVGPADGQYPVLPKVEEKLRVVVPPSGAVPHG
jgi:hypothetical protein